MLLFIICGTSLFIWHKKQILYFFSAVREYCIKITIIPLLKIMSVQPIDSYFTCKPKGSYAVIINRRNHCAGTNKTVVPLSLKGSYGSQKRGVYSAKLWEPTTMWRVGMACSTDMLNMETCHFIWWWDSCTNKPNLLTCKFVWCQTRSWREDRGNSTGKCRGKYWPIGPNMLLVICQQSSCWPGVHTLSPQTWTKLLEKHCL